HAFFGGCRSHNLILPNWLWKSSSYQRGGRRGYVPYLFGFGQGILTQQVAPDRHKMKKYESGAEKERGNCPLFPQKLVGTNFPLAFILRNRANGVLESRKHECKSTKNNSNFVISHFALS